MKKITLYTTGCPKCKILEKVLNEKGLPYIEVTDVEEMLAKGFKSAPVLEVDGVFFPYDAAQEFLKKV